jgi:prepilin peptidase CpaA
VTSSDQDLVNIIASLTLMIVIALAVRQDLVEHRISNLLTLAALAAGLSIHSLLGGLDGFVHALAGAGIGLVCLLPLYLGKGMGAGDVKLMAAAGAFLGPFNAFVAAVLTLVFGAVLAVVVLVWRMIEVRQATAGAPNLSQVRKERFPYAVAIGLGAVATMWLRGMLDPLLRSVTTP